MATSLTANHSQINDGSKAISASSVSLCPPVAYCDFSCDFIAHYEKCRVIVIKIKMTLFVKLGCQGRQNRAKIPSIRELMQIAILARPLQHTGQVLPAGASTPTQGNKTVSKEKHEKASNRVTLIELMIVIAIIAILASLALPAYQTYAKKRIPQWSWRPRQSNRQSISAIRPRATLGCVMQLPLHP